MTDEQAKKLIEKLDVIQNILEETFKAMNKNNNQVLKAIHTASENIQAMQMIESPPSAEDIAQALARILKK